MSEEREASPNLFDGKTSPRHPEREDKVREYVAHRLKDGANLKEVLREEYVLRNSSRTEREEMIRDPELVQKSREGLEEDFGSEELKPEHPTKAAQKQGTVSPGRAEPPMEVDTGRIGPPSTGA